MVLFWPQQLQHTYVYLTRQAMNVHVCRSFEAFLCSEIVVVKNNITYSESVCVALVTQHAKRMSCITVPVTPPFLQYFLMLSHKFQDFRKKVIEHKMCGFYFLHKFCFKYLSF